MDRGQAITGDVIKGEPSGLHVVDFGARWERPGKYEWIVHAEHNCILNAARIGVSLVDSTMYVMYGGTPCMSCTLAIIQAGVSEVVMGPTPFPGVGQGVHYHVNGDAHTALREAGVGLRQL
jgi:dCMP deaminase